MKQYLFIIILITIFVFYISLNPIKESIVSTTQDNYQINISSSESLRDFLAKMYYICILDGNTLEPSLNIKPTVCYKINRLYFYFNPIKDFFDNKTEFDIMEVYGPKKQAEIAGQPVGEKPPLQIIGSNQDYYTLIILFTYVKMLQPYNEMQIWAENEKGTSPSVTSICNYSDNDSTEFVKCANNMLKDITKLLKYFQYQIDDSSLISYGDTTDTGTGAVPKPV